jgi:putative addiction module component (TIGR02574 family)
MAIASTSAEIIASALRLPISERARIVDALQESLVDETIDHGPTEPPSEVETAWSDEIARRIAGIDTGGVKTIPAEDAERMMRGNDRI